MRRPAPPDEGTLHEAARAHLARFATTEANLRRVLMRRIERWVQSEAEAPDPERVAAIREAVGRVVARLAAAGAVDDAVFAAARADRLVRTGHSRSAVAAHLAARGVGRPIIDAVAGCDPEAELAAALKLARRRRIGPFRAGPADLAAQRKEFGVMARAGFPRDIALRALEAERDAAEVILQRLKDGQADGRV